MSEIHDHPYRILIIDFSGSGKTNPLLNLIKQKKFTYILKIQMKKAIIILLKKHEKIGRQYHKDPKVLFNYPNNIQDVYKILKSRN